MTEVSPTTYPLKIRVILRGVDYGSHISLHLRYTPAGVWSKLVRLAFDPLMCPAENLLPYRLPVWPRSCRLRLDEETGERVLNVFCDVEMWPPSPDAAKSKWFLSNGWTEEEC